MNKLAKAPLKKETLKVLVVFSQEQNAALERAAQEGQYSKSALIRAILAAHVEGFPSDSSEGLTHGGRRPYE